MPSTCGASFLVSPVSCLPGDAGAGFIAKLAGSYGYQVSAGPGPEACAANLREEAPSLSAGRGRIEAVTLSK